MLLNKGLISLLVIIGIVSGSGFTANAATTNFNASQPSHTAIDRAVRTVENERDKIFVSLMDVGKRCLVRDEICRFYYRGYYYETPWWTAPEIY